MWGRDRHHVREEEAVLDDEIATFSRERRGARRRGAPLRAWVWGSPHDGSVPAREAGASSTSGPVIVRPRGIFRRPERHRERPRGPRRQIPSPRATTGTFITR